MKQCIECDSAPPEKGRRRCGPCHRRRRYQQVAAKNEPFPDEGKPCSLCNVLLPKEEFHKTKQGKYGLSPQCKSCTAAYSRKRLYGLEHGSYLAMVRDQGGRCAICGTVPESDLFVDHDHTCCPGDKTCGGCVRGLLCGTCNSALGKFRDDPKILRSAIEYLDAYEV